MPSAEDLIPDFDELDNKPPVEEEQQTWPVPPPKKGKKKKKGRQYAPPPVDTGEEDDEIPFARPIAPSPPAELQDINLGDEDGGKASPLPEPLLEEAVPRSPPPVDTERDAPLIEDTKPLPKPAPPQSPEVRSPRPAAAKPAPNPVSPPFRPSTLHSPPQRPSNLSGYRSNSSTAVSPHPRRESFPATQASPRARYVEPVAPPHMPQPHFYTLPDLGLNFGQKKDPGAKLAGSDGYCCCFDSFADSGDAASSKKAKDALLVGSEGGVEVYRVLPNKFEVVGRLEGLRGGVIGAKILPYVDRYDVLQDLRPLVAVIVHGPMHEENHGRINTAEEPPMHYQTTVEVYSLQTQKYIATLYRSVPVPVEQPTLGQLSSLPQPVGDLRITAQGNFVILASGKSGEVFVFSNASTSPDVDPEFRCLAKLWTSLQTELDDLSSRPRSSSETSQAVDEMEESPGVPLFSLGQRWLALVPPFTSAHISIQGSPLLPQHNPNPPGLATHVAQPPPQITCEIAKVDAEDAWSRLTRQAAQGVVKYSQKGIDLGWQGWKELTNPTPRPGQQHGRTPSREHDHFPPTKALPEDPGRTAKEPALVSIVDLQTLLEIEESKPKYTPPPLSTFALVEGCNFVSFSPTGLRMLTVSRSGMIATIWDLSRACHGSTKYDVAREGEAARGPCVKLVHQIPRSSQSVVVDCTWSKDDEYVALLTTHGTVHLHEVPTRALSRKRKRRGTIIAPTAEKAEPTVSVSQGLSPPSSNGFLGSIKSGWQQVSTQVNTMRSQNPVSSLGIPTTFAGFKEATANASHAGGRVLAKGLSQGYSAAKGGASDYWHAEDNKIRHKALQGQVHSGSLRWVKKQSDQTFLAIVCGGTVHLHPVQRIERRKGDVLVSGLKQDKHGQKHFALPPIRTSNDVNGATGQTKRADDCAAEGPHGFWSLRISSTNGARRISGQVQPTTSSQVNEVETNPPYCPFHIDSRVDIFAFEDTTMTGSDMNLLNEPVSDAWFHMQGHGQEDEESWVFGEQLPPSTKMNTHDDPDVHNFRHGDEEYDTEFDEMAEQVESRLTVHTTGEDGVEEIRILTRRTHGRGGREEAEVDMFGDDDDSEM